MHDRLGFPLALTAAVAAALLLVLWASMSGPVSVTTHAPRPSHASTPAPVSSATPTPSSTAAPSSGTDHTRTTDLGWFGELMNVLIVVGLTLVGLWLLRRWYDVATRHSRRRDPRLEVAELAGGSGLTTVRAELLDQYARQMSALGDLAPRNGIVQAWVLFEDAAARAGVARASSETSIEFVVRLLHVLEVDPAAVGQLRGLYVEARFSRHPIGTQQRDQARAALETIHAGVAVLTPVGSPTARDGEG